MRVSKSHDGSKFKLLTLALCCIGPRPLNAFSLLRCKRSRNAFIETMMVHIAICKSIVEAYQIGMRFHDRKATVIPVNEVTFHPNISVHSKTPHVKNLKIISALLSKQFFWKAAVKVDLPLHALHASNSSCSSCRITQRGIGTNKLGKISARSTSTHVTEFRCGLRSHKSISECINELLDLTQVSRIHLTIVSINI